MSDGLDYWDRRLDNWARCYLAGANLLRSSLDPAMLSVEARERLAAVWEEPLPVVLLGEAADTDGLICRLVALHPKAGYFQAIVAWYWESGTKEMVAKRMKCHRETLRNRVNRAKEILGDLQYQARRDMLRREAWAFGSQHIVR